MMLALGDTIAVVLHERRGFTHVDFKILHPGGNIGAKLIRVYEIMHKGDDIPLILHNKMAFDALIEMSNKRLGCVGIIDNHDNLIGMLTDGDIRRHIDCDFKHTYISEIMTKNPISIHSNIFASEALNLMNTSAITNLFILQDAKPIGVIHIHDILKAKVV
jgi:arabinose-5-phosphate isomerase